MPTRKPHKLIILSKSDIERFKSKVKRGDKDACWEWQAATLPTGYGAFMTKVSGLLRAPRVAYFIAKTNPNQIPDGLIVCHKCDNPRCCNPHHLFAGGYRDNGQDMSRKGRSSLQRYPGLMAGEKNGAAKITAKDVVEIRKRKFSITQTAKMYGLSTTSIKSIRSGKSWRSV